MYNILVKMLDDSLDKNSKVLLVFLIVFELAELKVRPHSK